MTKFAWTVVRAKAPFSMQSASAREANAQREKLQDLRECKMAGMWREWGVDERCTTHEPCCFGDHLNASSANSHTWPLYLTVSSYNLVQPQLVGNVIRWVVLHEHMLWLAYSNGHSWPLTPKVAPVTGTNANDKDIAGAQLGTWDGLQMAFSTPFAMNFPPWLVEGALMTKGDFTKVTFKNGIMTKAGMLVALMFVFGFKKRTFLCFGKACLRHGKTSTIH